MSAIPKLRSDGRRIKSWRPACAYSKNLSQKKGNKTNTHKKGIHPGNGKLTSGA
jgi:hypothetical protein